MPAPLIGITTSRILNSQGHPLHSVTEQYVDSVAGAGGAPLLVPLGLPAVLLRDLVERLDGILFTGGGDMNPQTYGGEAHPEVDDVDDDRDRVELAIIQETLRDRKPFLGICRGLQLVNVAAGGTLYEHINDQFPKALEHCYYPDWPRDYLAHDVAVSPGSRLAQILGQETIQVNSQHHQGIARLAPGLHATAFAPDGLVEGVEMTGYPFGLAVQWHPEWLQEMAPMRSLFASFVAAARHKHGSLDVLNIP